MMRLEIVLAILFLIKSRCEEEKPVIDVEEEERLLKGYLLRKMKETIPLIVEEWIKYKSDLGLVLTPEEDRKIFFSFGKNLIFIKEFMEKENASFEVGINPRTHFSREEYFQTLGFSNPNYEYNDEPEEQRDTLSTNQLGADVKLPDKDWRKAGVITPIKDQKKCGSCYAFATAATVESAIAIKTKRKSDLSEQSIVDCSYLYGNKRCKGGNYPSTYQYLMEYPLPLESAYPYKASENVCRLSKDTTKSLVAKYVKIKYSDENDLSTAVSKYGPVAVGVDSRSQSFQFYKSGIYKDSRCSRYLLDHAVVVVGIGSSPSPYYIIRNSYSTTWGDQGYMKMARFAINTCGVATGAAYPIVK